MANTVLIKRSGTSSVVPLALESGEIAINYADGKLFYKNSSNSIVGSKLISDIIGTVNQVSVSESSGTFTISLPSSVYVSSLFVDNIEIDTSGATVNYVLKYNGTKFTPGNIAFGDISGILISSATPDQFLKWDGSNWINADIPQINALGDIGDVNIASPNAGQVLSYDGENWVNIGSVGSSVTVSDTAPESASEGDLWFDSTNGYMYVYYDDFWIQHVASAQAVSDLDDIGNVVITSATPEQFLKWDGSNWVNANIPQINALDDIGNVDVSTATTGQFLKYNGSNWINDSIPTINNLNDIGDVVAATPSTNQVLSYDGSNWIATNVSSATGTSYAETIGDGVTETFTITHNLGTKDVFVSIRESGDDYENLNVAWRAVNDSSIEVSFDSPPSASSVRVLVYSSLSSANGTTYTASIGNGSDTEITVTHNLGTRNIIPVCRLATAPYNDVQVSWEALTDDTIKFYFGSAPDLNSIQVVIFSSVSGSEVGQSVESLTNTNITSLSNGQFLKWNGSEWINDDIPTINTLNDVGDVVITSATPGQLVKWNGSNWVNSDTVGDLTVTGNLTVSGTTTTINTENLLVEDNIVTLNSNVTGSPTLNAGIEIERGTSDNVQLRWNEETDKWQFTNDGSTYKDLGSGGVTVSDTVPSSPAEGDMWYESDTGALFAYYDSFWIEIGGSAAYDQIVGSIQAKGDLLVGDASQSITRLAAGTNNKKLSANSSTSTGLEWVDDSQNTVVDAVGDILIGATPNLMTRLPLGSNGQVLTVDSNQTYGLGWSLPPTGFRNLVMNGDFRIAQRGTSFVSGSNNDDTYNLDRWTILSDGNDIVDITQSIEVPTGGINSIGLDVETANKKFGIVQFVENENIGGLQDKNVWLSFKARTTGSSISNVKAVVLSWTGTADSVTSDVVSAWGADGVTPTWAASWTAENTPENLGVTNSWGEYRVNALMDTSAIKNVAVFIWCDDLTTTLTDFLYITDVQLEINETPTPFERRPFGVELQLCQRYYWRKSGNTGTTNMSSLGFGVCTTTTTTYIESIFPVFMRIPPTISIGGSLVVTDSIAYNLDVSSLGTQYINESSARLTLNHSATGTIRTPHTLSNLSGSLGFLQASAEL